MSSATTVQPLIYVLIGCPGSGKGTFSQAMKSEGYKHFSIGDFARKQIKKETQFGQTYKEAILKHAMEIPFEVIQEIVDKRLEKCVSKQRGLILDGYPKTRGQCELLDEFIEKNGLEKRVVVVLLDVNEELAIDRILYRETCKCGQIYNSKFSPSKVPDECDECHEKLTKRLDYDEEGTKKRVSEFKSNAKEVIEHYTSSGRLNELDANADPEVCLEKFMELHRSQISKV